MKTAASRRQLHGHFPFFVGGRVSITVVLGRRIATETGMYCPVRASRPILSLDGFLATMGLLLRKEPDCPRTQRKQHLGQSPYARNLSHIQHLVLLCAGCARKHNILCFWANLPTGQMVFLLFSSFYTDLFKFFQYLRYV